MEEGKLKLHMNRRHFGLGIAALLGVSAARPALAADRMVKIGAPQDFTRVYTFVTNEYSQGQRDLYTLVNQRGGVAGYGVELLIADTANDITRGIEAYERFKLQGVALIDPLSTPVARALVPRAMADKINLMTVLSGRSDAADGDAFPYVMPLSPNYWSQAAAMIQFIEDQEGSLQGKRIASVYIDTPFGREHIPVVQALAEARGFTVEFYPYAPPGTDQSATWPQVRRFRPDWTLFWGVAATQVASLNEARRNGIRLDRMITHAWLSESDIDAAGRAESAGVLKFELAASGRESRLIQEILAEVVEPGRGAGPNEKVGTTYYNLGVMSAAIVVEGIRRAAELAPGGDPTGEWLNAGLRSIDGFTADGMLPPLTVTPTDHQGGGAGRIAQWDGSAFVPRSDWISAYQDIVWEQIRLSSDEFRRTGN